MPHPKNTSNINNLILDAYIYVIYFYKNTYI